MCVTASLREIADGVRGSLIPRYDLRRVPMRYRRTLPLPVMKRYQCIVVGAAQGVLTVAITNPQDTTVIEALKQLTGRAIFPVLIDPTRMRLLIDRIERGKPYYGNRTSPYYEYQLQASLSLILFASNKQKCL